MCALKYLLLTVVILFATPAFASHEDRQGFLVGFGVGGHGMDMDVIYNGSNVGSQSESGLATSFKMGGGITDQFALYYVRNASWFKAPYFDGQTTKEITYTMGLSGLGASYFLSPSAPSGYFLGALGIGDMSAPLERGIPSDTGSAFMLGGGYEFSSHVMVEVTGLSTNIKSADISALNIESLAFQLTLNYIFY